MSQPMSHAPVSVIIPCFRCVATLDRAVASVALQTLRPAEVILVDDASGDGTRALLHKLQVQYGSDWIKLVLLVLNVGAASARNAGWAASTHPYIAFLDSDDAWHPQKIEIQYGYMQAHSDVAMSGHDFGLLESAELPRWSVTKAAPSIVRKWSMVLKNQFVTPSVMVRRNISQRFIDGQRHMEDHMLWMCVVCDGLCVAKLSCVLVAIYKESYGVSGLSSQIWLMARSDLSNYRRLFQGRYVNFFQFCLLVVFSALKLLRRLVIYFFYLRWKRRL